MKKPEKTIPKEKEKFDFIRNYSDGKPKFGRITDRIKLYKYMDWEGFQKSLDGGDLKLTTFDQANDPFESMPSEYNELPSFFLNYGFISMTPQLQNAAMWGHYGNGHKGICLQFTFDVRSFRMKYANGETSLEGYAQRKLNGKMEADSQKDYIIRVNYNERNERFSKYIIDFFNLKKNSGDIGAPTAAMTRKDVSWKFEDEFRIIMPLTESSRKSDDPLMYFTDYINRNVTGIILGARCEHSIEEVEQMLRENMRFGTPKVIKAKLNPTRFLIDVPGIKEYSPDEEIILSERREANL